MKPRLSATRGRRPKTLGSLVLTLLAGAFFALWEQRSPSPPRVEPDQANFPGSSRASEGPAPRAADANGHDLAADEARGGHTLARHVGKTDGELRARLDQDLRIAIASTFTDLATASSCVGATLETHRDRIAAWVARGANRPTLPLDYRGTRIIGRSLRRGASAPESCTDANIVLRPDSRVPFIVLTAYPEPSRGR